VLFGNVFIETARTMAGSVGNYGYPELIRRYAVLSLWLRMDVIITCVYRPNQLAFVSL